MEGEDLKNRKILALLLASCIATYFIACKTTNRSGDNRSKIMSSDSVVFECGESLPAIMCELASNGGLLFKSMSTESAPIQMLVSVDMNTVSPKEITIRIAGIEGKAGLWSESVDSKNIANILRIGEAYTLSNDDKTVNLSIDNLRFVNEGGWSQAHIQIKLNDKVYRLQSLLEITDPKKLSSVHLASYNVEHFRGPEGEQSMSEYKSELSNWSELVGLKAQRIAHALVLSGRPEVVVLQEIRDAESFELLKPWLKKLGYSNFSLGKQLDARPGIPGSTPPV